MPNLKPMILITGGEIPLHPLLVPYLGRCLPLNGGTPTHWLSVVGRKQYRIPKPVAILLDPQINPEPELGQLYTFLTFPPELRSLSRYYVKLAPDLTHEQVGALSQSFQKRAIFQSSYQPPVGKNPIDLDLAQILYSTYHKEP